MEKLAKVVRVLTIPPVMALLLIVSLAIRDSSSLGGAFQISALIFFLCALPVLAYPLQPIVPWYNKRGREGQRDLAFVMAGVGYVGGIVFAFLSKAPVLVHVVYWTYAVSVGLLTLFNNVTPWRASGHACGVAGPLAAMVHYIGKTALPFLLIFFAMMWASIKIKRHTLTELVLGGIDSVAAFLIVLFTAAALT